MIRVCCFLTSKNRSSHQLFILQYFLRFKGFIIKPAVDIMMHVMSLAVFENKKSCLWAVYSLAFTRDFFYGWLPRYYRQVIFFFFFMD